MIHAADELAQEKVAIFLDDYHLVSDAAVNRFLAALEERGGTTKVFLITRRRPPVLGQLRGVVEEQLKQGLDVTVCSEFLHDVGVVADSKTAQAIWEITGEGHPKALQLFAYRAKKIPIRQLLNKMPIFREDLMQEWLLPMLHDLGDEERSVLVDLSVFDRSIPFVGLQVLFPEKKTDVFLVSLLERFLLDVT